MTREELVKQKAHSLGQKYFPDRNNVWARPNFEAQFVSEACIKMAEWERKRLVDMACEWLREEKGYYVYPYYDNNEFKWTYSIREKTGDKWIPLVGYDFHLFDTYELALEDALKYALENLV